MTAYWGEADLLQMWLECQSLTPLPDLSSLFLRRCKAPFTLTSVVTYCPSEGSHETARVHRGYRLCSDSVAARTAGAAAGEAADHWVFGLGDICNPRPMGCRFCATTA